MGKTYEDCPLCLVKGKKNSLRSYWINFDEVTILCPDAKCVYPLGVKSVEEVIERRNNHSKKKRRLTPSTSAAPSALPQSSVAASLSAYIDAAHAQNKEDHLSETFEDLLSELSSKADVNSLAASACPSEVSMIDADDTFDMDAFIEDSISLNSSATPSVPIAIEETLSPNISSATSSVPIPIEKKSSSNISSAVEKPVPSSEEQVKIPVSELSVPHPPKPRSPKIETDALQSPEAALKKGDEELINPVKKAFEIVDVPCDIDNSFVQWKNLDNLCWLDVSMTLVVHCSLLSKLLNACTSDADFSIRKLLGDYSQAQTLQRKSMQLYRCLDFCKRGRPVQLETSVGRVKVPTGGGDVPPSHWAKVDISHLEEEPIIDRSVSVMKEEKVGQLASKTSVQARELMTDVREDMWRLLQPLLRCRRGQEDSPVFALPLLLKPFEKSMQVSYRWRMKCTHCSYAHADVVNRIIPTIPFTPADFSMSHPYFTRNCLRCEHAHQSMVMDIDHLPDTFFMHFIEGLHRRDITEYDFARNGQQYAVKGVVQYCKRPNHFIAWIRNPVDNLWMECDDMKSAFCQFTSSAPTFPASQMHLVMWERQPMGNGYKRQAAKPALHQSQPPTVQMMHKWSLSMSKEERIKRMKERLMGALPNPDAASLLSKPRLFPKRRAVRVENDNVNAAVAPVSGKSPKLKRPSNVKKIENPATMAHDTRKTLKQDVSTLPYSKSVKFMLNDAPAAKKSRPCEDTSKPVHSILSKTSNTSNQDTVIKLEISNSNFNKIITLKSPVRNSSGSRPDRPSDSPDISEILEQLKKSLRQDS